MVGLKSVVTEASDVHEEVVLETIVASEALDTGGTCINLNLISEYDFDYTTLNHKSPTPSPIPSYIPSLKLHSSPTAESIGEYS